MSEENTNTSNTQEETVATAENVPAPVVPVAKYPTTLSEIGTFLGREKVVTTTRFIDETNICKVLAKAIPVYERNVNDITFLYNYYRGLQPILNRTKQIRPDICNKIVENHAEEIVSFYTGYVYGDSIIYAGRSEEDCSEEIQSLNAWNAENDADAQNITLGEWLNICGVAYKMAVPRRDSIADDTFITSPYITTVLDPREACVVYYNGIQEIPVLGFKVIDTRDSDVLYNKLYCCYTENGYYEIPDTEILSGKTPTRKPNPIGRVPIVEYPANIARRGRLEPVIPIMDALNILASNRLDGVEQFIQSILLFRNVDVDSTDVDRLNAMGAIKYRDVDPQTPGEVRYITAELNQEGAQTLKDDLYQSLLIITGMPNRNGGNSTSDTGTAVIYRDGFFAAETKAKAAEKFYIRSEKELLKVILRIVGAVRGFNLHLANIDIKFTRKNYENTLVKSQVLTTMLNNEKIAPRLAFVYSGMFSDPEAAWKESMDYFDSHVDEETEVSNGEDNASAGDSAGNRAGTEQGISSGSQN